MPPTNRLYLDDDHCVQADATVVAVSGNSLACDRTCFYPGGGGQPPDQGTVRLEHDDVLEIVSARADPDGVVWHVATTGLSPDVVGQRAHLSLDRERRLALTRHHTVLHVLNTTALRDYGGLDHRRADRRGLLPDRLQAGGLVACDVRRAGGQGQRGPRDAHVSRTSEVGRLSIYRTENKGKINKRLYVRLASP